VIPLPGWFDWLIAASNIAAIVLLERKHWFGWVLTLATAKITIIGDRELRVMAAPGYFREDASELLGWKKGYLSQEALEKKLAALKGAPLAKAAFVVLTAESLLEGSYNGDAKERQQLVDLAKAYKLDPAKVERELAAPSQTSAPKKKRGRP
jgi:hypothetical protein